MHLTQNRYSPYKIANHPEKIKALREGRITAPIYVRIKPTNRCNHACNWCLLGGTQIKTPDGERHIETLKLFDSVISPDGQTSYIVQTSSREANNLWDLWVEGGGICGTAEHPFLVERGGFCPMGELRPNDKVNFRGKFVPIKRLVKLSTGVVPVYNFTCEPDHAYIANGFAVHNCAYQSTNTGMHESTGNTVGWKNMPAESLDEMPTQKLLEIIHDLAEMGVKCVTFSGGGEPLLHPAICEAFKRVIEADIKLSILTNGQALAGERARLLSSASWVRVSVDYANGEQMAASRGVPARMFQQVMDNLANFSAIKSKDTELTVNFIVTAENHFSLYDAALALKSAGVQNVRFSPVWRPDYIGYHSPLIAGVEREMQKIRAICDEGFSVASSYNLNDPQHGTEHDFAYCPWGQIVPAIGADLNVYFCHNTSYSEHGRIGSIRDRGFKNFWFSSEAREAFMKLTPSVSCKHQCAAHGKIQLINGLTEAGDDPFI